MTTDVRKLTAALLGELCLEAAREPGRIGALAENLPPIDEPAFIDALAAGEPERARVAILGGKARYKSPRSIDLTVDPAEANRWRNDADARRGVHLYVLALGHTTKLNSLRTALQLVPTSDLRRAAAARALRALRSPEREVFWRLLERRAGDVPTAKLLDFAAAIDGLSGARLEAAERANMHRIGLVPSESLFNAKGSVAAERALRRMMDLLDRLRDLSSHDRDRLAGMMSDGSAAERTLAKQVLQYSRSRRDADLEGLTEESVRDALKWTARSQASDPGSPSQGSKAPIRKDSDELVAELMLKGDKRALHDVTRQLQEQHAQDDEDEAPKVRLGREQILIRPKPGMNQSLSAYDRFASPEAWGGLLRVKGDDAIAALKRITDEDAEIEVFQPSADRGLYTTLRLAVDRGLVNEDALRRWERYVELRNKLLNHRDELAREPLLAVTDDAVASLAEAALVAYGEALQAISEAAQALDAHNSHERARRLIAQALALDAIFINSDGGMFAILTPVHPFHLWRYTTLASLLRDRVDELREISKESIAELLGELPPVAPNLVLSPFAVTTKLDGAYPLIPVGILGSSIQFAEATTRHLGRLRGAGIRRICEHLMRVMPHAGFGLRIALIDPPPLSGVLEDLRKAAGVLPAPAPDPLPLHVTVFRTRAPGELSDEDGDALDECAQELHFGKGTLELEREMSLTQVKDHLKRRPAHIAVVFDPAHGQTRPVGVLAPPPMSPLATSRVYRYDPLDDRFEVVVAGESPQFRLYHDLFCRLLDMPRTNFLGRRSGASQDAADLAQIAEHAMWTVIADQGIEPTLSLPGARRIDWRTDTGRDLVTFTRYPETVEDLVRDAVRQAGLPVDEETVKRTLVQLFELSGEAVLGLARPRPNVAQTDPIRAKGVLGVLAAVRWYTSTYSDALVISLDDPTSHRWVLGHQSDDRHGDLLAVRPSGQGVVVEAIEVKAHNEEDAGITERQGTAEGKAVVQVEQTIRVLRDILDPKNASPVAMARAAVLRDQVYRAVAARPYERPTRERMVNTLAELFERGPSQLSGVIFKVRVDAGAPTAVSPTAPRYVRGPGGEQIGIVELIERGASATVEAPVSPAPRREPAPNPRPSSPHRTDVRAAVKTKPSPRVRILIGDMLSGGEVYWDPHDPERPLNNFGLHITGDSGAGKTQTLRAVIAELVARGMPVCVFDFKNDYAKADFSGPLNLRVYDVARTGLPFNPLSLVPDKRGEVYPMQQVHEVASILRRVFQLGDQQEASLKEAIKAAYTAQGFSLDRQIAKDKARPTPTFNDVKDILEAAGKNEKLLNRLSPLFDLHLFPVDRSSTATFEQLLEEQVVLDLHELPDERIKAAIAEFMIARLHMHVLRGDQPRELRRLLVFDEAWRVGASVRLQELAREGRAFGVGIALGTQFPGDIPENLSGNLATQLFLQNQDADHCKSVVRALTGSAAGNQARQLSQRVAQLQKFEGFFRNQQFTPYVVLKVTPHHLRTAPQPSTP